MGVSLFQKIINLLNSNNVWFELLEHEPVYTSQQAAAVRPDVSLHQGAKAMVLTIDNGKLTIDKSHVMVVVPGDRRIDYKKVAKFLLVKDVTLASAEEVERVVGVKIGAVSPLGHLSGLKVLVDEGLLENQVIAFNAGAHSKTVKMKSADYLKLSQARVGDFSKTS